MEKTQFDTIRLVDNAPDTKQANKKQTAANCPDINTFAGYLDNNLADPEKNQVEQHMASCGTCRTNLYEIKMLMDQESTNAPDELASTVKKNLQQTLGASAQGRKLKI